MCRKLRGRAGGWADPGGGVSAARRTSSAGRAGPGRAGPCGGGWRDRATAAGSGQAGTRWCRAGRAAPRGPWAAGGAGARPRRGSGAPSALARPSEGRGKPLPPAVAVPERSSRARGPWLGTRARGSCSRRSRGCPEPSLGLLPSPGCGGRWEGGRARFPVGARGGASAPARLQQIFRKWFRVAKRGTWKQLPPGRCPPVSGARTGPDPPHPGVLPQVRVKAAGARGAAAGGPGSPHPTARPGGRAAVPSLAPEALCNKSESRNFLVLRREELPITASGRTGAWRVSGLAQAALCPHLSQGRVVLSCCCGAEPVLLSCFPVGRLAMRMEGHAAPGSHWGRHRSWAAASSPA